MAHHKKFEGLPSKEQVMELINGSDTPVGKREIARHFKLKGQEKIALKALLKDRRVMMQGDTGWWNRFDFHTGN